MSKRCISLHQTATRAKDDCLCKDMQGLCKDTCKDACLFPQKSHSLQGTFARMQRHAGSLQRHMQRCMSLEWHVFATTYAKIHFYQFSPLFCLFYEQKMHVFAPNSDASTCNMPIYWRHAGLCKDTCKDAFLCKDNSHASTFKFKRALCIEKSPMYVFISTSSAVNRWALLHKRALYYNIGLFCVWGSFVQKSPIVQDSFINCAFRATL